MLRRVRCRLKSWRNVCIFFFQAEDGIRDLTVTGVQTCALPISQEIVLLRIPLAIVVRAVLHARVVYAASAKCRDGHAIELGREGWCCGAEIQEEVHFVVHSPL